MNSKKTLLEETYKLVRKANSNPNLTIDDVIKGAKVKRDWYLKFKREVIPDPGVNKVQRVHDFLSKL